MLSKFFFWKIFSLWNVSFFYLKPILIFDNNVDVAVEREVEGDLLLGDMGQVYLYI